jgi:hypothetical protein
MTTDVSNETSSSADSVNSEVSSAPKQTKSFYSSSGSSNLKSKVKKKILKKLSPLIAILAIIILIIAILSLLKIPNYASNIAGYRLVRSALDYAKTSGEIDAEKIAESEIASDPAWKTVIYDKYSSMRTATWGKFDSYRPEVLYKNLNSSGNLGYKTEESKILGVKRVKITSVVINGEEIAVPQKSGIFSPIDAFKERVNFSAKLNTAVGDALHPANSLVRSSVAAKIRNDLGIKLHWWERAGGYYKGLNADQADVLEYKDSVEKISTPPTAEAFPTGLDNSTVTDAQKACDSNVACTEETIARSESTDLAHGGLPDAVASAIDKETGSGILKNVTGVLSPTYAIALPLCLIYSGSIINAKNPIDAQSASAVKSFYAVESASDQQKSGNTTSEAVGALNRKLGDGDSAVDQYSRGEKPDTTNEKSPQSGITGEFTLVNSFFGNSPNILTLNSTIHDACSLLTNVWISLGIGIAAIIVKIVSGIVSGGTLPAAEEAGQEALTIGIENAIKTSFIEAMTRGFLKGIIFKDVKVAADSTLRAKAGDFVGKFAGNLAGIEAFTALAKLYVFTNTGLVNDGGRAYSTGFKDQADMGGDIQNNELERKMNYGAPLNDKQVAITDSETTKAINNLEAQKPIAEKYFAISDSHSAIAVFSNQLRYVAVIQSGQFITHIFRSFSDCLTQFINILSPQTFAASDTAVSTHYGIVQWGWTDAEQTLIDTNTSYSLLDNALYLSDHQSDVDNIVTKYGHCFTDSLGTLLSQGDIMRDNSGNVADTGNHLSTAPAGEGDCSPTSLGPNNPQFGDLVFRWRLDERRQSALDQNLSIQNLSPVQ